MRGNYRALGRFELRRFLLTHFPDAAIRRSRSLLDRPSDWPRGRTSCDRPRALHQRRLARVAVYMRHASAAVLRGCDDPEADRPIGASGRALPGPRRGTSSRGGAPAGCTGRDCDPAAWPQRTRGAIRTSRPGSARRPGTLQVAGCHRVAHGGEASTRPRPHGPRKPVRRPGHRSRSRTGSAGRPSP